MGVRRKSAVELAGPLSSVQDWGTGSCRGRGPDSGRQVASAGRSQSPQAQLHARSLSESPARRRHSLAVADATQAPPSTFSNLGHNLVRHIFVLETCPLIILESLRIDRSFLGVHVVEKIQLEDENGMQF